MQSPKWSPVTLPANEPDPRGQGLDFVLTQNERSKVASFKVALERNRRQRNELDRMQANAETAGLLARSLEQAA